jgi:hypothetical protein
VIRYFEVLLMMNYRLYFHSILETQSKGVITKEELMDQVQLELLELILNLEIQVFLLESSLLFALPRFSLFHC